MNNVMIGAVRNRPLTPPLPLGPGFHCGKERNFTKGSVDLGCFWYTNFWTFGPRTPPLKQNSACVCSEPLSVTALFGLCPRGVRSGRREVSGKGGVPWEGLCGGRGGPPGEGWTGAGAASCGHVVQWPGGGGGGGVL